MGQFIDQVNKNNNLQNEVLSLTKQKQLAKEEKDFKKYRIKKYQLEIRDKIEDIYFSKGENAYNYLINARSEIIGNIFEEIQQKNKTFKNTKYTETENKELLYILYDYFNKTNEKYYKNYKKENTKNNDIDYMEIEKSIEKCYQNNGILAYELLERGKFEILEQITTPQNYLKIANFHDKINKKYYKIYKEEEKEIQKQKDYKRKRNKVIISSILLGTIAGFKKATKPKKRRF
jgi:hypothetical protein